MDKEVDEKVRQKEDQRLRRKDSLFGGDHNHNHNRKDNSEKSHQEEASQKEIQKKEEETKKSKNII